MGKEERIQEKYEIEFILKKGTRKNLRDKVVNKFLEEKGGYWKDNIKHVTFYKYYVEKLSDGRRIYLLRPTFLNKGIDFQVWVEKFDKKEDKRPSHKDIFQDLEKKKKEDAKKFKKLVELIEMVWNCQDSDEVLRNNKLNFKEGFSIEMLLKILKWLFIEQDITYWNYDGRNMLYLAIKKVSE